MTSFSQSLGKKKKEKGQFLDPIHLNSWWLQREELGNHPPPAQSVSGRGRSPAHGFLPHCQAIQRDEYVAQRGCQGDRYEQKDNYDKHNYSNLQHKIKISRVYERIILVY